MRAEFEKCAARMLRDRSAAPGAYAFAAREGGRVATHGEPGLSGLAAAALSRLRRAAVLVARPSLPFAELLVRRAPRGEGRFVPGDSETRTFLHDIPYLRGGRSARTLPARVAEALSTRGAAVVEGVGIAAAGAASLEQACVHYSAAFHATFVKYLRDLLREGWAVSGEREAVRAFRDGWAVPPSPGFLPFRAGPLEDREEVLEELAAAGRHTVDRGLVDSVFGNISCLAGGIIHISRTGASLDDLPGNVVEVPLDASGAADGIASSELPIHRRIYETGAARTVLHGHPRFTVVLSMLCEEADGGAAECAAGCARSRFLWEVPVVAGETGAAGARGSIPASVASHGIAVVCGHGVFAAGRNGFEAPFLAMEALEERCRRECFRRLGL